MHSEEKYVLILGAGQTGLSATNFLKTKNFKIFDTRNFIDLPENIKNNFLIKENLISEDRINIKLIDYVICSPGFDLSHQIIKKLKNKNIRIKSDIEVFIENNESKIILVSGTNGKTTVSLLLEKFISLKGYSSKAIGNIGRPALDYVHIKKDYFVIEVSSFHLEISDNLKSDISILLNISEDHLDRHKTFDNYKNIKNSIFNNSNISIGNKDDENIRKDLTNYFDGNINLDIANLNAVKATLDNIGINYSFEELEEQNFKPEHRMEVFYKDKLNRIFINDSKATNCGATLAAINSIKGDEKIFLICGGQSKGADFSRLAQEIKKNCYGVIIYGEDKNLIIDELSDFNKLTADSFEEVISLCLKVSKPDTKVLFSPACASFDMFKNFEDRGNKFKQFILNERNS